MKSSPTRRVTHRSGRSRRARPPARGLQRLAAAMSSGGKTEITYLTQSDARHTESRRRR